MTATATLPPVAPASVHGGRTLADYARQFREDGLVHIPQVLDPAEIALVEQAFAWKLEHPGPGGSDLYPEAGARFFQAKGDSSMEPSFATMLHGTRIADVVAVLFGDGPVWYLEEQLFLKEGGTAPTRRTPWHQDSSYQPMTGDKSAVVWIGLDPVQAEHALEVIRGSHRGPIYNASRFDPTDDTAPFLENDALPRMPNIQAERDRWDIVASAFAPGDLLIFHPTSLHGGGGTTPGARRRSLTLRFVGDDARKLALPGQRSAPQTQQADGTDRATLPVDLRSFYALADGEPVSDACRTKVRA